MANVIGTSNDDNLRGDFLVTDDDNNPNTPDVVVEQEGTNDTLFGGPRGIEDEDGTGNDLLNGLGGIDDIFGGDGNDVLFGGGDADQIFGEKGNDTLDGGEGDDELNGSFRENEAEQVVLAVSNFSSFPNTPFITLTPIIGGIEVTIELPDAIVDDDNENDDINGIFFNLQDDALLANLEVSGSDVTLSEFQAESVNSLDEGAVEINPAFDAGIRIEDEEGDDIEETTFTLSLAEDAPEDLQLDLADFTGQDFALDLTRNGENTDLADGTAEPAILQVKNFSPLTEDSELTIAEVTLRVANGGIEVTVESFDAEADLDGLFFTLKDNELLDNLVVQEGENLTSDFGGNVTSIGEAEITSPTSFDAGIGIDDDISSTTFTLALAEDAQLELDDFSGEAFGLVVSDVGVDGEGSSDLSGTAQPVTKVGADNDDDVIFGQSGDDTLNGGPGDDLFDGGNGNDTINGGLGADRAALPGTLVRVVERVAGAGTFEVISNNGPAYEIELNDPETLSITITDLITEEENIDSGVDELQGVEFLDFSGFPGGNDLGSIRVADLFAESANGEEEIPIPPFGEFPTRVIVDPETTSSGDRLFNLDLNNVDQGDTITFTIDGNEDRDGDGDSPFAIDDENNQLIINDPGDIGEENFDLTVTVSDDQAGGEPDTVDLTVVTDDEVTPEFAEFQTDFVVNPATASQDELLVSLYLTENLNTDALNFAIDEGNEDRDGDDINAFRIDDENNQLVINDRGDLTGDNFALTVTVDDGEGAIDDEVDLNIAVVTAAPTPTPIVSINTPLTVTEGRLFPILNRGVENGGLVVEDDAAVQLDADDNLTPAEAITYTLESVPQGGTLLLQNNPVEVGDTFTQNDINRGFLVFDAPDQVEDPTRFNFRFTAADPEGETTSGRFNIDVSPFNATPDIDIDPFNEIVQDGIAAITDEFLDASDEETDDANLIYTLTQAPQQGQLNIESPTESRRVRVGDTFTQANINNGDLRYSHTGEQLKDSFSFTFTDGDNDPINGGLDIVVEPSPEGDFGFQSDTNEVVSLRTGETVAITTDELSAGGGITYRVQSEVSNGTLFLDNNDNGTFDAGTDDVLSFQEQETFTQRNIDNGNLLYAHDGSATRNDNFSFVLEDNQGQSDAEIFLFDINPVPQFGEFPTRVIVDPETTSRGDRLFNLDLNNVDEGDAITFTIDGNEDQDGDGASPFAINENNQLIINDPGDIGEENFDLTVTVSDDQAEGEPDTVDLSVVTDEEVTPEFAEFQTDFVVNPATASQGELLASLDLTENLNTDALNFGIEGNEDRDEDGINPFRIDENNQLLINDRGDLTGDNFALTVTVDDGEGAIDDEVDLNIAVVTAAPTFSQQQFITAPVDLNDNPVDGENDENGTVIDLDPTADGINPLTATDPDDEVFFEIVGASNRNLERRNASENNFGGSDRDNDETPAFTINQEGQIRINSIAEINELVNSVDDSYTIKVSASDASGASSFAEIVIPISSDFNQAPVLPAQTFEIPENSDPGTEVGTLQATDPDGDEITFSEAVENPNFNVAGDGVITVADGATLDFETQSQFNLTVTATDDSEESNATTRSVTINLTDQSEQPPTINDQTFDVDENSNEGTVVGTVVATDADGPDQDLRFEITDGNTDVDDDGDLAFAINNQTGELEVRDSDDLDFEEQESFSLTVEVTDGEDNSSSATITVNVNDLNEPPTINVPNNIPPIDVADSNNGDQVLPVTVDEQVLSVTVDEPDGQTVELSLLNNPDRDDDGTPALAIDNNGVITIADIGDLTENFIQPTIVAEDSENAVDREQITIPVDTPDPDPPFFVGDPFEFEIPEQAENPAQPPNSRTQAGTVVGQVTAIDPDTENLEFTLAGGNDNFEIRSIEEADPGEITIIVAEDIPPATLDFEEQNTFNLRVLVEDPENDPVSADLTINLTDVDELPDPTDPQNLPAVSEDDPKGTLVGTVEANDPEDDPVSFSITGGNIVIDGEDNPPLDEDNPPLAIDDSTGQVTVNENDDLVPRTTINLDVQITQDETGFEETITANINVGSGENEPPEFNTPAVQQIDENNTFVVNLSAQDTDGDDITFSIVGGADSGQFSINEENALSFNTAPDFENPQDRDTDNRYLVNVQAVDGNGGTTQLDMLVEVEDVNEPPVIPDDAVTIPENTELDPDLIFDPEGDDFNLVINSGDNLQDPNAVDSDDFIVFNNENLSFAPDVAPPDFENPTDGNAENDYLVEVTATETTGDERTVTGTVRITVGPVNEPPEFEGAPFEFTLNPNQAGEFEETVVATDPEGEGVTFNITDGNDPDGNGTGAFAINDDGVITVADAEELPEQGVFNLTVQATDTSEEQVSSTEEVTINVTAGNLDIGGNGDVDQSDALLLQAQLFGTPGLIQAVSDDFNSAAPDTVTRSPDEIETFIQDNPSVFDIGGNEDVDQSDALLLQAQLFGTPGLIQAVSNDFNSAAPDTVTRTPDEIEQFIADNSPAA
jgi:hypothetical protein